jgi:hypothetical protein
MRNKSNDHAVPTKEARMDWIRAFAASQPNVETLALHMRHISLDMTHYYIKHKRSDVELALANALTKLHADRWSTSSSRPALGRKRETKEGK